MCLLARGLPLLFLLAACSDLADVRLPETVPDPVVASAAPDPPVDMAPPWETRAEPPAEAQADPTPLPVAFPARRTRPVPAAPATPTVPIGPAALVVSIEHQWMELQRGGAFDRGWPVSTSAWGAGSTAGSNQTPLGRHRISAVFGAGAPLGTIFVSRSRTDRIATITTDATDTAADHVTTRILWLEGLEPDLNQGPGVDTKSRYIYIHGTPEEGLIGQPASHGCIRMKNADVVELFALVGVGTPVTIIE